MLRSFLYTISDEWHNTRSTTSGHRKNVAALTVLVDQATASSLDLPPLPAEGHSLVQRGCELVPLELRVGGLGTRLLAEGFPQGRVALVLLAPDFGQCLRKETQTGRKKTLISGISPRDETPAPAQL